jgi:hypothetical protein
MTNFPKRAHVHRAKREVETVWSGCVVPRWERSRRHDAAHGGIILIRTCRCGAKQFIEANMGHRNWGGWDSFPNLVATAAEVFQGREK